MGNEVDTPVGAAGTEDADGQLLAAVEQIVRAVVAEEVVPRWRRLAASDIAEKNGPHDLVTTADRAAEAQLARRLTALLPGSVVVGEEAVSEQPALLGLLREDAPVWVVDPVDGTAAFVRGETGFSTLVSLVRGGRPVAGWTYAPQRDQFATALLGHGAHLNGERLHTAADPDRLRLWISNPVFRTPAEQAALARLSTAAETVPCLTSAGLGYLEVARGDADGVAFFWEAPWDHSAGLLLVSEAGGTSRTAAGEPFRVAGGNALPFTVSRDAATARRVIGLLTAGESGAPDGGEGATGDGRGPAGTPPAGAEEDR